MSMGTGVLLAEALTLGVKAGVDLGILADVINNSSGGSMKNAPLEESPCWTLR